MKKKNKKKKANLASVGSTQVKIPFFSQMHSLPPRRGSSLSLALLLSEKNRGPLVLDSIHSLVSRNKKIFVTQCWKCRKVFLRKKVFIYERPKRKYIFFPNR